MRIGIALVLWAILAAGPALALQDPRGPPGGPPGCGGGEPRQDRLLSVTPEGGLVLGSEPRARLAGIRLPDHPPDRQKALAWLAAHAGRAVLVTVPGKRDRWDRLPVLVRMAGPQALDLNHGLVEAGLAIVDPDIGPAFCQPELLALEETARERHLGLWADGRYNPLSVGQVDRLKERVGSFVIVEGRIRSIGERKQRTYLNFGGHWAEDFTIIIPKKTWMLMARRGLSADSLKGRAIRARGILQSWQGTALTVDLPEMIERLEDESREGRRLAR